MCDEVASSGLHGGEALLQVGDDVVDVLGADGEADGVRAGCPGPAAPPRLSWEWVVVAGWMTRDFTSATLASREKICQVVDELVGLRLAALDLEGEDGSAAVGEVLLIQGVVGMVGQGGVVDLLHLGMVRQVLHDLLGVLHMALQPQGQGLHALEQQEGVEGRDGRAGIPQQDRPDVGDEGGGAGGVREASRRGSWGSARRCGAYLPAGLPVEGAAVHDDAAQAGAVAADELGGGVDHDVCAVLDGPDQIGGAEGVVDDQGQAVLVGDGGDGVDVGDVAVGVAQGLQVDCLGVVLDGALHLGQVVGVHKGGGDAVLGQGVGQQVVGAAVDGLLGHDVLAVPGQGLNGVGDGGGTGGHGQRSHAALQGGDALLQARPGWSWSDGRRYCPRQPDRTGRRHAAELRNT